MAPTISSLSTSGTSPTAGSTTGAGNPGNAPTGSINDLFAQLKEFSWKGVSFPVTETELEVRQDLVIHKFADRNGAYVEDMGRHPVQVTARIPFLNHIYSASSESWAQGNLYPYQWRLWLKACLEGTSGTLQHPELGPLNCKIDLAKTTWSGTVRGGVIVQATWIESDDTQADQLSQDLSSQSPIAQLTSSADDLDANITTLQSAVSLQQNPLPPLQFSFSQLAGQISAVIDTGTILQKEFQGATDNVIYQCNRVETSLNLASAASPLNWPIFQSCERLKSTAYALKAQPSVASGKTITSLVTQKDSTIAQLALSVGESIDDFIKLNSQLVGTPVVPANTVILYYSAAA
jgi:prophage DNA circulation protein